MNYIAEINGFERWLENNYLPALSELLWYKLMYRCNRSGWAKWVTVDNLRLMADLRIESKNTFLRCRDALVDAGLIECQKGKKGAPNKYRLIPFEKKGSNFEPQMELKTELQTEPQMELKTELETGHIYKQKQKLKKKDANASKEKSEPQVLFAPDSFEVRCVDRLICALKDQMPNTRVPVTLAEKQRWAVEIERMKRLDNRSETEILEALEFATTDSFWKANIRSTAKLREKCETLILHNRRKQEEKQGQGGCKNRFHNFEQREYDYDEMVWKSLRM